MGIAQPQLGQSTRIIENMIVFSIFNVTEAHIARINLISVLEVVKMPV
jgi:hypothetical protein